MRLSACAAKTSEAEERLARPEKVEPQQCAFSRLPKSEPPGKAPRPACNSPATHLSALGGPDLSLVSPLEPGRGSRRSQNGAYKLARPRDALCDARPAAPRPPACPSWACGRTMGCKSAPRDDGPHPVGWVAGRGRRIWSSGTGRGGRTAKEGSRRRRGRRGRCHARRNQVEDRQARSRARNNGSGGIQLLWRRRRSRCDPLVTRRKR